MARVNIEEECFARAGKMAEMLGCSLREALGTLTVLWHDSQEVLAVDGTREQILDWARLFSLSEIDQVKWINALTRSRFISHNDKKSTFLIHGNEIQIQGRLSRIRKGHKGAEVAKKKWRKLQATSKRHPSNLEPTSNLPNTIQGKAVQGSAKQEKKEVCAEVKKIPPPNPVTAEYVHAALPDWGPVLELYEGAQDWVEREIRRQAIWLTANRRKIPKSRAGWNRFITTWLERGWDKHRKTIPSNSAPTEKPAIDHSALWDGGGAG